jgi:uncharacterized SAM-binding protein YcdF (DUF218 family)
LRRVRLKQIEPMVAVRLILRSIYRIVRASVVLLTLLLVALLVLLIITSGTTIRKLRDSFARENAGTQ